MTLLRASTSSLRAFVSGLAVSVSFLHASCVVQVEDEPGEVVSSEPLPLLQEVFFDDFASGLARWTETGEGDWNTEGFVSSTGYPANGSGQPAGHSDGCTTTCSLTSAMPIDLSDAVGGRVGFLRFVSSLLDTGEFLEVQVWNGTSWVRTHNWTDGSGDDSTWRAETIDLAPYAGVADFRIRFNTRQSSTLEHVHVDDVRVSVETDTGGGCGDDVCSSPDETCSTCADDCGACPGGDLFVERFANLAQWTESGEGDWNVEALHSAAGYPAGASGAPAAHSDTCGTGCTLTMANSIDLRGVSRPTLRFLRFVDSELDAGEFLSVELFNGSTWNTAFSWTNGGGDDNQWHLEVLDLAPYSNVSNFRMRLNTRSSLSTEHVHIDDIRIAATPPLPPNFQVSQAKLAEHVGILSVAPRSPGSAGLTAARGYCASQLQALGYTVENQNFTASGYTGQNVIGKRTGSSLPNQTVMLSAHIDSVPDCLGADDNASGVAGVLESARLLALNSHPRTVAIACWDLEEVGLLGSRAYASRARMRGENIRVSFVYDQIGIKNTAANSQQIPGGAQLFGSLFPLQLQQLQADQLRGDFIGLVADAPGFATSSGGVGFLGELVLAASSVGVDTLSLDLTAQAASVFEDALRSDHDSFWSEDYSAVFITDTGPFRSATYHCLGGADEPGTLDYGFARQVTQATTIAALRALDE